MLPTLQARQAPAGLGCLPGGRVLALPQGAPATALTLDRAHLLRRCVSGSPS